MYTIYNLYNLLMFTNLLFHKKCFVIGVYVVVKQYSKRNVMCYVFAL